MEDLPFLFHICENQTFDEFSLWGADFVYQYPPLLKQMEDSFLSRENMVLYAVEWEHAVAGFVELADLDKKKKSGVLARLIVDKNQRGRGLGKAFVKEVLKLAALELELDEVCLVVYERNTRAQSCYEACGFRYDGELIRPGRPDALRMKRSVKELGGISRSNKRNSERNSL